MKRFLVAASSLVLALSAPALSLAQINQNGPARPDNGKPNRPEAKPPGGGPNRPGHPNRPGDEMKALPMPGPGKPGASPPAGGRPPNSGRPPSGGRPPGGGRPPHAGPHRPPHRPGYRPPNRPIFGWNGHRFHLGLFAYPAGYGYRRWSVGQALPPLFLTDAYFFTDYAALGLDPPPYGYEWVRYGPDVLMVNIRTGQIMDVVYGVFN